MKARTAKKKNSTQDSSLEVESDDEGDHDPVCKMDVEVKENTGRNSKKVVTIAHKFNLNRQNGSVMQVPACFGVVLRVHE